MPNVCFTSRMIPLIKTSHIFWPLKWKVCKIRINLYWGHCASPVTGFCGKSIQDGLNLLTISFCDTFGYRKLHHAMTEISWYLYWRGLFQNILLTLIVCDNQTFWLLWRNHVIEKFYLEGYGYFGFSLICLWRQIMTSEEMNIILHMEFSANTSLVAHTICSACGLPVLECSPLEFLCFSFLSVYCCTCLTMEACADVVIILHRNDNKL